MHAHNNRQTEENSSSALEREWKVIIIEFLGVRCAKYRVDSKELAQKVQPASNQLMCDGSSGVDVTLARVSGQQVLHTYHLLRLRA